ncbi:MAG: hypothetical protein NC124_06835 [Clostridium sp.]|nr:hypothetical protein [Clostridium sp.]
MKEYNIKIGTAFLLIVAYFGVMLFYTFLDVAVWRKVFPDFSNIVNIIIIAMYNIFCLVYKNKDRLSGTDVVQRRFYRNHFGCGMFRFIFSAVR